MEPSARAAMRLTCSDAQRLADEYLDRAVLRVGGTEQQQGDASFAAAFHKRLCVKHMYVCYEPGPHAGAQSEAPSFCSSYAAGVGGGLAAATSCELVIGEGQSTPTLVEALTPVVGALPHLRELRLCFRGGAASSKAGVVAVLALLAAQHEHQLHVLRIALPDASSSGLDDLSAEELQPLCALTQLRTLHIPWPLPQPRQMQLCAALPHLAHLAMQYHGTVKVAAPCHSLRALTLYQAQDDEEAPAAITGRPEDAELWLAAESLLALPALQTLHGCTVSLWPRHMASGSIARLLPALERLAASAQHWKLAFSVQPVLDAVSVPALRWALAPGCLHMVRHLMFEVAWDEDAPDALQAGAVCLAAAAPGLHTLCVDVDGWGQQEVMDALLPPLRQHCAELRALWVTLRQMTGVVHVHELLLGLARGLVTASGAGGGGCCALQRVVLEEADSSAIDPRVISACNDALAAQGHSVRVGSFV